MKRLLVVFLIGFMVFRAFGQPSVDVGIFGGAGTYFGDMTKTEFSKSVNPAYGAFMRYNFNPRYALRFNVVNGTIGAEGQFESQPWKFNKNVLDISLQYEFNFYKYIVGEKTTPYSSYLFAGIGMQTYKYTYQSGIIGEGSEITPTIPFGIGFKVNLSKRWGLGIEGGMRKTFSDKLDNLDDPLSYEKTDGTVVTQVTYADRYHNNDWTAYAGIHLVYKMIYGSKEWDVTTPKKKILDWGIHNNPNNR
ncbi:MAG TPA: DUF6089 family protein [Prolixibacteraceae bacterium]|jgi:hypothetical protein